MFPVLVIFKITIKVIYFNSENTSDIVFKKKVFITMSSLLLYLVFSVFGNLS